MNEQAAAVTHRIGAAGSLTLNNVSGSVRVRGIDSEEASVVARSGSGSDSARLVIRRSEGGLFVEPERKGVGFLGGSLGFGPGSVDFEVTVPHAARVEISTVSADLDVDGLDGEQQYKCVSGDMDLTSLAGRISFTTVSGDVAIDAVGPVDVSGNSTSGDVRIRAPRIDVLRVRTVSGDVTVIGGLQAGPAHSVETVSGDLDIESETGLTVDSRRALDIASRNSGQLVVGDGAARLSFRSMSGDVHVTGGPRRERAPAEVKAATPPEPPEAPVPTAAPPPPTADPAAETPTTSYPATPRAGDDRSLEVLRALERGEIDVDEASRLLEVAERG